MRNTLYLFVLLMIVWGCSNENKVESAELAATGADTALPATDTSAMPKIIRTADMRMRVSNALKTKEAITKNLQTLGGTTIESTLTRNVASTERIQKSPDSLLEVSAFYYQVSMKVSVPATRLEDFLHQTQGLAVYIDEASMKRDDQQLKYLENSLLSANRKKLMDMTAAKKLSKTGELYTAVGLNDDYVRRKIENMHIDQQVRFSTVRLEFYEGNSVSQVTIANDKLSDFGPPFFSRLWMNILAGWMFFKEFLLLLAHLWMLPLIGLITYLVIKRYKSRRDSLKTVTLPQP
ncbi:DUF4349 domain-containing protein [Pedobacter yulinensis]|nr:DUF4349 domain-containing protein [Pedobacter yulinensis]